MSLSEHLQEETRVHQGRLELLPCYQALQEGTLPPERLRAVSQVLAVLEEDLRQALATASHPALRAVSAERCPPHPRLARVAATPGEPPRETLLGAVALGERLRAEALQEPLSLLGRCYALRLAALPHPECPEPWRQFARRLEGVRLQLAEQQQVARAARDTLEQVRALLDTLHPPRPPSPVTWLNPSAGSHPIPEDPLELRASLRAGESAWHEFPYYAWRYGERGRQFTWSDSAWLATLSGRPAEAVWKQVSWLGRLLAARGIPRMLLERHLRWLYAELVRTRPERQQAYAVLEGAAERLAEERRQWLSDGVLQELGKHFEARVGAEWSHKLPGTGLLLGAAVADERGGIAQAVPSLTVWLGDGSRFPPEWVLAVEELVVAARERTQSARP